MRFIAAEWVDWKMTENWKIWKIQFHWFRASFLFALKRSRMCIFISWCVLFQKLIPHIQGPSHKMCSVQWKNINSTMANGFHLVQNGIQFQRSINHIHNSIWLGLEHWQNITERERKRECMVQSITSRQHLRRLSWFYILINVMRQLSLSAYIVEGNQFN